MLVKDTTKRIMKQLMTNDLAKTFNFRGHGNKHAMSALSLVDVVFGESLCCLGFTLCYAVYCQSSVCRF